VPVAPTIAILRPSCEVMVMATLEEMIDSVFVL
jgi:hypothetical protein